MKKRLNKKRSGLADSEHRSVLAASLALATKEYEAIDIRMTREVEQFLNDNDYTFAHMTTSLEKSLVTKADLMLWKLDDILSGSNREKHSDPIEDSRQVTDRYEPAEINNNF